MSESSQPLLERPPEAQGMDGQKFTPQNNREKQVGLSKNSCISNALDGFLTHSNMENEEKNLFVV